MTMTHSEAGKLATAAKRQREEEIEAYAAQFRPKPIRQYMENGYLIVVYEPATAHGANRLQRCQGTARRGDYL